MKTKKYLGLFISLVLTVCLTGCSLAHLIPGAKVTGTRIRYTATDGDGNDITPSNEDMEKVRDVLEARLSNAGYYEARVSLDNEVNVIVELPADDFDNYDDISNELDGVLDLLGTTAHLTFEDADGNVVLDGTNAIKKAEAVYGSSAEGQRASHYIKIEFTPEAREAFADATAAAAAAGSGKNYLSIRIDGQIISSPRVQQKIDSATCQITGDFTQDMAKEIANQINSGALPVKLKLKSVDSNVEF